MPACSDSHKGKDKAVSLVQNAVCCTLGCELWQQPALMLPSVGLVATCLAGSKHGADPSPLLWAVSPLQEEKPASVFLLRMTSPALSSPYQSKRPLRLRAVGRRAPRAVSVIDVLWGLGRARSNRFAPRATFQVLSAGLVIINNLSVFHQITWQYKFVYLEHDPVIVFVRLARTGSPELVLALWFLCQLWITDGTCSAITSFLQSDKARLRTEVA